MVRFLKWRLLLAFLLSGCQAGVFFAPPMVPIEVTLALDNNGQIVLNGEFRNVSSI